MLSKLTIIAAVCAASALAGWKQLSTVDLVALDLKFSSETEGYISGGENGVEGIQLAKTTDGGLSFNTTTIPNTTLPLSISIAINPPHILVNGLFDNFITHDDGNTWSKPIGADVGQALWSIYSQGKFFIPGAGLWGTGIAVSEDNGYVFKGIKIPVLEKGSIPRFSAHPTADVWYVSAGAQPQEVDDDPLDDDPPTVTATARSLKHTEGGNVAQMVKTTDGGKTWESQLYSTGKFYFMDIDCADTNTCCVNSEADTMSPTLGIAIYCTFDGKTWNTTYTDYTAGQSLMDIKYLGNNNWVASGTFEADNAVRATFVRSSDNGKTWTPDEDTTTPQLAVVASSWPAPNVGFALGIDRFNTEMLIGYTA